MFFSIIIPVYNVEKYLKECVDSVLNQTFCDFELILVNDGSTDQSGAICDEYAKTDSRIKVFHKENGGQSSARNMGVKNATGKYAVFLDSDDLFCDKNFLADIHTAAGPDTDIVVFKYSKYYGDRADNPTVSLNGITVTDKPALLRELVRRDAFFCSCWSKCTRLEILQKNNIEFNENLSCEDMDWYYNVVSFAKSFKVIDKPYVYYRQRENSVTSVFKEKSITDYIYTIKLWKTRFEALPDADEREVMLCSLAKLYCNLLISYSANSSLLKKQKKDIFSFKKLLSYNLNPRTKVISRFSKIFGLNITCLILKILQKVR